MSEYEYKVVAAPTKGVKAKGVRTAEDRFSHALETKMNELAAEGWEYRRAEALPSVERSGLPSTKTVWHNVLVFRRRLAKEEAAEQQSPVDETIAQAEPANDITEPDASQVAEPTGDGEAGPPVPEDPKTIAINSLKSDP